MSANNKKVILDFEPDGSVKIEAKGFRGVGCTKATAFLEIALGRVAKIQRKPEFNQNAPANVTQTAGR